MTYTFDPSELSGNAILPCSKSEAHRRLIIGSIAEDPSSFSNFSCSEDIQATLSGLEAMGAVFSRKGNSIRVFSACKRGVPPVIDCGESASTLRFLLPLTLIFRGGADFVTHGALGKRSLAPYEELLDSLEVHFKQTDNLTSVRGSLLPGNFRLAGQLSSQFASGLLMTLPLLNGDSVLTVTDPVSTGYLRMTERMLLEAGIRLVETTSFSWRIPGNQHPHGMNRTLAPDASAAAFFHCANKLEHQIHMDLPDDSDQPDAKIQALLASGGPFDAADTPDLVPVLGTTLALIPGTHIILHCERLRHKESDRLSGMVQLLNALGGKAETDGSRLIIHGVPCFHGGIAVDCLQDHRLVMAAILAATRCELPVTVPHTEALNKSWPDFLAVYRSLGGQFS